MSTQAVHFLKVTGTLASQFERACEAIRLRKPLGEPGCRSGNDWHGRDREKIDHLSLAMMSTARALPVVWYSQFVSGYSWGWAAEPHGGWVDGVNRSIYTNNTNVAYFPAAVLPATLSRLKRMRRTTVYDRHLRMAIEEMAWAQGNPLVVVISECLGGSWYDPEVHASSNATLRPLLAATRDRVPPQRDGRSSAGLRRSLLNLRKKIEEGTRS